MALWQCNTEVLIQEMSYIHCGGGIAVDSDSDHISYLFVAYMTYHVYSRGSPGSRHNFCSFFSFKFTLPDHLDHTVIILMYENMW